MAPRRQWRGGGRRGAGSPACTAGRPSWRFRHATRVGRRRIWRVCWSCPATARLHAKVMAAAASSAHSGRAPGCTVRPRRSLTGKEAGSSAARGRADQVQAAGGRGETKTVGRSGRWRLAPGSEPPQQIRPGGRVGSPTTSTWAPCRGPRRKRLRRMRRRSRRRSGGGDTARVVVAALELAPPVSGAAKVPPGDSQLRLPPSGHTTLTMPRLRPRPRQRPAVPQGHVQPALAAPEAALRRRRRPTGSSRIPQEQPSAGQQAWRAWPSLCSLASTCSTSRPSSGRRPAPSPRASPQTLAWACRCPSRRCQRRRRRPAGRLIRGRPDPWVPGLRQRLGHLPALPLRLLPRLPSDGHGRCT
mmetsp:Transcript_102909/g.321870  ORF Transcript_102909/g.321870 Transcript_102909/m.321870 type:complete len:358 (-) Transcript_102909:1527-2600(-)